MSSQIPSLLLAVAAIMLLLSLFSVGEAEGKLLILNLGSSLIFEQSDSFFKNVVYNPSVLEDVKAI